MCLSEDAVLDEILMNLASNANAAAPDESFLHFESLAVQQWKFLPRFVLQLHPHPAIFPAFRPTVALFAYLRCIFGLILGRFLSAAAQHL